MNRITQKDLEVLVKRINTVMGTPLQPYAKNEETVRHEPQANCYHLSYAYGGVSLHKMSSKPGCTGVSSITSYHMPKRELYDYMQAYLSGIYDLQNKGE